MIRSQDIELLRGVGLSIVELFIAYYFIRWFCGLKIENNLFKLLQKRWKPFLIVIGLFIPVLNLTHWISRLNQFFTDVYVSLMLAAVLMLLEVFLCLLESLNFKNRIPKLQWSIAFSILRAVLYIGLVYHTYSNFLQKEVMEGGFLAAICCTAAVYMCLKFIHGFFFEDTSYRYELMQSFMSKKSALGYGVVLVLTAMYAWTWVPSAVRTRLALGKYLLAILAALALIFVAEAFFVLLFDYYFSQKKKKTVSKLIQDITRLAVYLLLATIILTTAFNINLSSLLVGSTALSVILGFALQDTMGNLVAGVLINFAKPYKIGDYIDIGGLAGTVEKLDWRSTVLKPISGERNILPNSTVAKSNIKNFSFPTARQARSVEVGAGYEHSPDLVRRVIMQALRSVKEVMFEPAPKILLTEFADSSINYKVVFWVDDFSTGVVAESKVRESIWYNFSREKINIPFPITTVIKDEGKDDGGFSVSEFVSDLKFSDKLSAEFKEKFVKSLSLKMFGPSESVCPCECIGEKPVLYLLKSGLLSFAFENAGEEAKTQSEVQFRRGDLFVAGAAGEIPDNSVVRAVEETEILILTVSQAAYFMERFHEDWQVILSEAKCLSVLEPPSLQKDKAQ
ncbi:mechanosensitive ion channel family protein [bacterium]|nr:mechanosensitive ion channel family protein [bacterium]